MFAEIILLLSGAWGVLSAQEQNAARVLNRSGYCVMCSGYCDIIDFCDDIEEEHFVISVAMMEENRELKQKRFEQMKVFSKLEKMYFQGCNFQKGIKIPFESWPHLNSFTWFNGDKNIPREILEQLVQSKSLTDVHFKIADTDLHLLTQMKSLKSLSLKLNKDTDLRVLLPLSDHLLELSLSGEVPEDLGSILCRFTNLRILRFHQMPLDVTFLTKIKKIKLATLWLVDTKITDDCIPILQNWNTLNEICICFPKEDCKITSDGEKKLRTIQNKKIWLHKAPFARGWMHLTEAELRGKK